MAHPPDALAAPAVAPEPTVPVLTEEPPAAIDPGELKRPPNLQEYAELAPQGAARLLALADLLESRGALQRALLAWERVLDLSPATADQARTAIAAIKRVRPTLPAWNQDRAAAITITLRATTSKKSATTLTPALAQTARDLERAAAGILKVTTIVTTTSGNLTTSKAAPVTLWLKGPNKSSSATTTLSFTPGSTKSLPDDLLKKVFVLVCGQLRHDPSLTSPVVMSAGENPLDALSCHITRLCWQRLGTDLNRPQKKHE